MDAPSVGAGPPAGGTLERWAWDYVLGTEARLKLEPPPPPLGEPGPAACFEADAPPRRLAGPGRPAQWSIVQRHARTPSAASLVHPRNRAKLCLTFAHHEIQAGELMAWAILAFPKTPREFRAGLARLCLDEARHARLYVAHARGLGLELGAHPVRDWFWQRVAQVRTPAQFTALLGIGFEGANLDHSARWAAAFRAAGDEHGAALQVQVGLDERRHVAFAARWFEHFAGPLEFASWVEQLPAPLTPLVLRGKSIEREARLEAGLGERFIDELERWQPPGAASAVERAQ